MIRHILLIKFKASAEKVLIDELKTLFEAMMYKIEGIESIEWGENNSPEYKNEGYTHCVLMNFTDQKGRENYLPHPEHNKLKQVFRPILEDIIVFDYQAP
jgi:hypothetical protein